MGPELRLFGSTRPSQLPSRAALWGEVPSVIALLARANTGAQNLEKIGWNLHAAYMRAEADEPAILTDAHITDIQYARYRALNSVMVEKGRTGFIDRCVIFDDLLLRF